MHLRIKVVQKLGMVKLSIKQAIEGDTRLFLCLCTLEEREAMRMGCKPLYEWVNGIIDVIDG